MIAGLDTRPRTRHLEPMSAQHGQTYDPDQEPAPRGGWFRLEDRPFPARLDRVFRWLAAVAAIAGAVALVWLVLTQGTRPPTDAAGFGWLTFGAAIAAALAYGFTRGIGLIALALYGAVRDGPELVVDWRALLHDLPLKRVQVLLAELALLAAAMGGMAWGLILFVNDGLIYGLAMFALINAMAFWPLVRRWWITGRAD